MAGGTRGASLLPCSGILASTSAAQRAHVSIGYHFSQIAMGLEAHVTTFLKL